MPKYNKKGSPATFEGRRDKKKPSILWTSTGIANVDIIIIFIAVAAIIASGIFLYTNLKKLDKLNLEIEEMQNEIAQKQITFKKLTELGASGELLEENYERNLTYLPVTKSELGIIGDVTKVVKENGGVFRTITYRGEVSKENNVTDVPFTLSINSTFEDLTKIVEEFTKTDRLYIIDAIIITESSMERQILTTDLEMHTYYKTE